MQNDQNINERSFREFRAFDQEIYFNIMTGLSVEDEKAVSDFIDIFEIALSFYVSVKRYGGSKVSELETDELFDPEFTGVENGLDPLVGKVRGIEAVEKLLEILNENKIKELITFNDNFRIIVRLFRMKLVDFKKEVLQQIQETNNILNETFDNLKNRVLGDLES